MEIGRQHVKLWKIMEYNFSRFFYKKTLQVALIYGIKGYPSRSGEIGKHAALKMLWEQSLVGSSPTFGT